MGSAANPHSDAMREYVNHLSVSLSELQGGIADGGKQGSSMEKLTLIQGAEDDLIAAARQVMENAPDPVVKLDVKLTVDAGSGPNWAVAH